MRGAHLLPCLENFRQQALENQMRNEVQTARFLGPCFLPHPPPLWVLLSLQGKTKSIAQLFLRPWDFARAEFCPLWSITCLQALLLEVDEVPRVKQGAKALEPGHLWAGVGGQRRIL